MHETCSSEHSIRSIYDHIFYSHYIDIIKLEAHGPIKLIKTLMNKATMHESSRDILE